MPDCRALIAGRLGVAEMANHLQDLFEAALRAGVAEAEAAILIFLPWVVFPAIALLTGSLVLQVITRRDSTSK